MRSSAGIASGPVALERFAWYIASQSSLSVNSVRGSGAGGYSGGLEGAVKGGGGPNVNPTGSWRTLWPVSPGGRAGQKGR